MSPSFFGIACSIFLCSATGVLSCFRLEASVMMELPTAYVGPRVLGLLEWTGEFFWLGGSLMWRHPRVWMTWVHELDATQEILGTTTDFTVHEEVDEDTLLAVRVLGWNGHRVVKVSAQHSDVGRFSVVAAVNGCYGEDDHPLARNEVVARFLVL